MTDIIRRLQEWTGRREWRGPALMAFAVTVGALALMAVLAASLWLWIMFIRWAAWQ